jgi:hypothetical protein
MAPIQTIGNSTKLIRRIYIIASSLGAAQHAFSWSPERLLLPPKASPVRALSAMTLPGRPARKTSTASHTVTRPRQERTGTQHSNYEATESNVRIS